MSQEKHNTAVIFRLNEAVNEGNYEAMDEMFSPSYVDHNPGWEVNGLDDFKKLIDFARKKFELYNTIEDVVASGDKVAIRVMSRGRHIALAFGVPPTGKATACVNHEIYRFEKGKIAERWVVSDILGLMAQLGVPLLMERS